MRRNRLWICLLLGLFFTSCALWPRGTTEKDSQTKEENQFDPLGFPQDRVIVTEKEPEEKRKGTFEPSEDNKIGPEGSKGTDSLFFRKVYRVQFFATKYPDEASQVADSVATQLSEKAYIDYKTPYYWVRVGDCATKEEAEILLEKIKRLGYKESWVVETEIKP